MRLPADGDGDLSGVPFFRSRTPHAMIVRVLLGLVLICATASAQETTRQIHREEALAEGRLLAAGLDPATLQPADKPPVRTHTGFKALVFETASDFTAFL